MFYHIYFSDTLFLDDFKLTDIISQYQQFKRKEKEASLLVYTICSDEGTVSVLFNFSTSYYFILNFSLVLLQRLVGMEYWNSMKTSKL